MSGGASGLRENGPPVFEAEEGERVRTPSLVSKAAVAGVVVSERIDRSSASE
jgi:hypothetical protein